MTQLDLMDRLAPMMDVIVAKQAREERAAQMQARDEALDMLAIARAKLLGAARPIARDIAQRRGRVTSVEVLRHMRKVGYAPEIDRVDARFIGAVFRCKEWTRIGWEPTGSRCRPVSIWRLG